MNKKYYLQGSGRTITTPPRTTIVHRDIDLMCSTSVKVGEKLFDPFWDSTDNEFHEYMLYTETHASDIHEAYLILNLLELEYSAGNKWSISRALALCALNGIPLPKWVASTTLNAFEEIHSGSTNKSWDDYFGSPRAPKQSRKKYNRDRTLAPLIIFTVLEKILINRPIHADTFEEISEELKSHPTNPIDIGTTKIKELFFSARQRSPALNLIIQKIKNKEITQISYSSDLSDLNNLISEDIFLSLWHWAISEFSSKSDIKIPDLEL
ncbi:hypothetical protein ACMXYR_14910 [Neptuniibacter sp. QD29_5]|uniref:hypothetical protein n=1 Tax=Neptuniibacter sp. QD29_5 TaxID=3398207 RepID=UPI0039F615E4